MDSKYIGAGVATLTSVTGIFYYVNSNTLNTPSLVVLFLLISFLIVMGAILIWYGIFGKDEKAELEKELIKLKCDKVIKDMADMEKQENSFRKFKPIGMDRNESDKKRDMYKNIKKYLTEDYEKELISAFGSKKTDYSKIKLISMLLELQNKGEFNPNANEEDDSLLQFFKKFYTFSINKMFECKKMLKSGGSLQKGALEIRISNEFNEALTKIEKKIEEY